MVDYPPVVLNWGHFKTYVMSVKYSPVVDDKRFEKFSKELKEAVIHIIEKHFKKKDIVFSHANINSGMCCRVSKKWEIELIFFQDGF